MTLLCLSKIQMISDNFFFFLKIRLKYCFLGLQIQAKECLNYIFILLTRSYGTILQFSQPLVLVPQYSSCVKITPCRCQEIIKTQNSEEVNPQCLLKLTSPTCPGGTASVGPSSPAVGFLGCQLLACFQSHLYFILFSLALQCLSVLVSYMKQLTHSGRLT